ncbi:MAG TPA: glycerol-3-phosphate dehydrogenase/oxidase [Acidimicrobiales bacterium]|nr:glycerol-3-phosphate dehydrogenase/oxidase [Acidimicrobiales bacterium]
MSGPARFDRAWALERLAADTFDVLVIGGGITGAGVALDAASRGLRTALVEREDFGSGTSSRSSKLVHGGLRYLSQGDYRLVAQALAERQRLLHNAPHLVRPLPFLVPAYGSRARMRAVSSALWLYDATGGFRIGTLHRRISATEALAHTPALRAEGLVGAHLYLDAQADDARLALTVARSAVLDHGAVAANHAGVTELLRGAGGRVTGARMSADGAEFDVRAAAVVSATGVWADALRADGTRSIRPAKGVHLTLPAELVRTDVALVLTAPADGRSIFVVPWAGSDRVYVGTTDTDYDGPLDNPVCTAADTDYLLGALNAALSSTVTPDDVVGSWAGLRPLVADAGAGAGSGRSADLSRRHRVGVGADGLVTIAGGKLTTYRAMAEDTVDAVQAALGRRVTPCRTRRLALHGAPPVARAGSPPRDDHLVGRHGTDARVVAAMVDAHPNLGEPLVGTLPYLRAEAVYAARYEMACSVDDVLARRTRSLILARDASAAAAPDVAGLLARELGWSVTEAAADVERYRAGVEAERSAATA